MLNNKLNDSKTEFLMIASTRSKYKPDIIFVTVGTSKIYPSQKCKSLVGNFSLKKIGKIPDEPIAQLIHSLKSSKLDYCNSLLYGMPEYELSRL